jgi:hypothetical protein
MAYLEPNFDIDVFVSYSHGDPRGQGDSPLKRWTVALIEKLEQDILALDTEFDSLGIWCDRQGDPTAHLTDELRAKVSKSGILMIVMSKRYLTSQWCKDEFAWFREQIQDRAGHKGRVFIIRAQMTDEAAWPDFLRDEGGHAIPGFLFHDPREGHPYGWPNFTDINEDFHKSLSRLSMFLKARLRELKQRQDERSREADGAKPVLQPSPNESRRIYLHASRNHNDARDEIKRALARDGFDPVTMDWGASATLTTMEAESRARIEMAKRCEALAFVNTDDREPDIEDFFQVCVDERERMEAARKSPLPCVVLDRSGGVLPFTPSDWRAERIDLTRDAWSHELRAWLDRAHDRQVRDSPLGISP